MSEPTEPTIKIDLQSTFPFPGDRFMISVQVTAPPGPPYTEVWVSLMESTGAAVVGGFRTGQWDRRGGTQVFGWQEHWFAGLKMDRGYKFIVALASPIGSEYQVESEEIFLQDIDGFPYY